MYTGSQSCGCPFDLILHFAKYTVRHITQYAAVKLLSMLPAIVSSESAVPHGESTTRHTRLEQVTYLTSSHVSRRKIDEPHAGSFHVFDQSHDVALGRHERRRHPQENLPSAY